MGMEHLDTLHLDKISDGDPEFRLEIFRLYSRDSVERIKRITTALKEKNLPLVKLEAHTLKGASMNVGAVAIRDSAAKIEELVKAEDFSSAMNIAEGLRDLLDKAKAAFRDHYIK